MPRSVHAARTPGALGARRQRRDQGMRVRRREAWGRTQCRVRRGRGIVSPPARPTKTTTSAPSGTAPTSRWLVRPRRRPRARRGRWPGGRPHKVPRAPVRAVLEQVPQGVPPSPRDSEATAIPSRPPSAARRSL